MTPLLFILTALCGLLIGILSGMFGVGGGIMMIPLLNLVFRLSAVASAATSLFVVAPTALSGALRHIRDKSVDYKTALLVGLAGAAAATATSSVSDSIPSLVIIVLAACLIVYCSLSMFLSAKRLGDKSKEGASASRFNSAGARASARIILGLFAGSMAGIVGLGGGFVIVPFAVSFFGYNFKQATAISLLSIAIIATPGIVIHAILGHVWYLYGIALMVGTIPGASIGARLISKIPEKAARLAFGVLLLTLGILLVANQLHATV